MSRFGIAVLAVAFAGCCPTTSESVPNDFTISPSDPALAAQVTACFDSDAMCERLCLDLLGPPPAGNFRSISECFVTRRADGLLDVHSTSTLTDKCDLGGFGPFGPPPPDAAPDAEIVVVDAAPPDAGVIGDAAPSADAGSGP